MPTGLSVGPIRANPGKKATGKLKLLELAGITSVEVPLIVINGINPGPVLYMGAASHGNEVNGIEICRRISQEINPGDLTGALVIVPIQNPMAFYLRRRASPIDNVNLDIVFPGRLDGSVSEIIAYKLYHEAISKADIVLDFHSAGSGEKYPVCIRSATNG